MSRDLVLGTLALGLCGSVIWLGSWIPVGKVDRDGDGPALAARANRSGRELLGRAWLRLWLPLLPAAVALAALSGWALQEPRETDEILRPLVVALVVPVCLLWLRAMVRAVLALRRPRAMPPVATVGLLRPRVVVDAGLPRLLDPRALAAAMAHERAHVRHRDPLRIWLAQIATDAQWPNPAARRRLDRWLAALELARDEDARREGIAGADLAAAIVAVAGMKRAPSSGPARAPSPSSSAGLTGAEVDLTIRIHRLLSPLPRATADPPAPRGVVPVALLTALAAATFAGLRFGDSLLRALPFITT